MATAIKLFAIVLLLCWVCEAGPPGYPRPGAQKKPAGVQAAPKAVNKPAGVQAAPKAVNKPAGTAAPKTVNRPGGGGGGRWQAGSKQLAAPKAGTAAPAPTAPPPLGMGPMRIIG